MEFEFWVVYSLSTFEKIGQGSGVIGASAYQPLHEGTGLVVVPYAVIADEQLNLDALRGAISLSVDTSAETLRLQFLTAGTGQAMTYQRKEAEARAWLLDNTTRTPFLEAEASACQITIEDLVPVVIARADQWEVVGALIEGERMGAKDKIARGETFADIIKAGRIDWQALVRPAPAAA
jgi:hypothetical protein